MVVHDDAGDLVVARDDLTAEIAELDRLLAHGCLPRIPGR
jgi:hypothetical protein